MIIGNELVETLYDDIFTKVRSGFGVSDEFLLSNFDFENLRVAGVLQRIALVYLGCSILYLHSNFRSQLYTGIALLISYWVFMMFIPFHTLEHALSYCFSFYPPFFFVHLIIFFYN